MEKQNEVNIFRVRTVLRIGRFVSAVSSLDIVTPVLVISIVRDDFKYSLYKVDIVYNDAVVLQLGVVVAVGAEFANDIP